MGQKQGIEWAPKQMRWKSPGRCLRWEALNGKELAVWKKDMWPKQREQQIQRVRGGSETGLLDSKEAGVVGKLSEGKRVSGDATEMGGTPQATRVLRLSSKAKESHRAEGAWADEPESWSKLAHYVG